MLAACGKATTAEPDQSTPPDPKLAGNPNYTTPVNYKTECLGRHLFDVPANLQWAMVDPKTPYDPGSQFTKNIATQNDIWFYGRLQVNATPPTTIKTFDAAKLDLRLGDKLFVDSLKKDVETGKEMSQEFKTYLLNDSKIQQWRQNIQFDQSNPMPGASDDDIKKAVIKNIMGAIARNEEEINKTKASIAEFREVDLKLPDSYARTRGDNLVAYLWRDKRVWRFATRKYEGETYDHMAQEFMDTLRHFRPRTLYEIPTEPGVCVPYGFFSDDGHAWYQIQNTLRLADAPNVTYTIGLGKNGDEPKPTGFDVWAASFMQGSGAAGMILNRQVTQHIKPRTIKIGAMQGILGGFIIKPDLQKGDDQEQSYHLQAGYNGEANSDFFPFVTLQMRSYTEGADPSLTQPAPPFQQSESRLLALAKSVRLRPVVK